MMRTMRESLRWVLPAMAVLLVAWLVFDVGMGLGGQSFQGANPTVLKVNGTSVRYRDLQEAVRAAQEQIRQQRGSAPTTREEQQALEDQVIDEMVQKLLLAEEYDRLGIRVTTQELRAALLNSPPPDVMSIPDFQTNGQFDITKWQRFITSGTAPEFVAALEARYREAIPQVKLYEELTSDLFVSDAKLWRFYRDSHDSVTLRLLAIRAADVPETSIPVSDAELGAYYEAHRDDFKRPAVAFLSYTALDKRPDASDTATALAAIRRVRQEVAGGGVSRFAEAARRESRDTVSGREGGDLGWVKRGMMVREFEAALFRLRAGELSQPVRTEYGFHLIFAEQVTRDSIKARHILIPVELAGAHLEHVDGRADSLDRYAGEQPDGSTLDSITQTLGLPLARWRLEQGDEVLLGRYRVPDIGLWAFEATPGSTSPVVESAVAFYVFRLDSLQPEGVPPLAAVRDRVLQAVRQDKRMAEARRRAERLAAVLQRTRSLSQAADQADLPAVTTPPFTRTSPNPAWLGSEPGVIGAAFGLRVGETSGRIAGQLGYYFLETVARKQADSTAWRAQLEQQRQQVLDAQRQGRMRLYVQALRERASISDRRKEVYRAAREQQAIPPSN